MEQKYPGGHDPMEEWPRNADEPYGSQRYQEDVQDLVSLPSRSSTPHLDRAEIGRVLSPSVQPGRNSRSRRSNPSIAHSFTSPSISESGEGEDPSSVSADCVRSQRDFL